MHSADSFVHLHLHTEYSMLDGASRIGDVVAAAAADGQPAVGITDHGNMYGALPMYRGARGRREARPRHGGLLHEHVALRTAEARGARDLPPHDARRDQRGLPQPHQDREHARTSTATTTSQRSDWELLERSPPGVTATTAASRSRLAASTCRAMREGRARSRRAPFQDIFGREHFFVEHCKITAIDDDCHGAAARCSEIARKLQAPLLATNDSH
jgi:DNA polymerase-3 subunit alpha